MVRLANRKEGNSPLMREKQLYAFLELEKPREEVKEPENERKASIQVVPGDHIIISDEERERDEIPDSTESPIGENFTSAFEQSRHEVFYFQENSRKIKMEKSFWKRFSLATKKLYLKSQKEHKVKDAKFNAKQEELADLQYSVAESEMLLAKTQRKL